jgi:rhodanese-related sulfurtransferase
MAMGFESIEAKTLRDKMNSSEDCLLIDVRTPSEYHGLHLQGAINLPLENLTPEQVRSRCNSSQKRIYVVCQSGGRSAKACQQLSDAGIGVVNVNGGTTACLAEGLASVRAAHGKTVMGLERQVRIAAGALVVSGVVLGAFVHPYGYGLSAFVGAGLVFAGVTDTCAMGMLIAKMPWNQAKPKCT